MPSSRKKHIIAGQQGKALRFRRDTAPERHAEVPGGRRRFPGNAPVTCHNGAAERMLRKGFGCSRKFINAIL